MKAQNPKTRRGILMRSRCRGSGAGYGNGGDMCGLAYGMKQGSTYGVPGDLDVLPGYSEGHGAKSSLKWWMT